MASPSLIRRGSLRARLLGCAVAGALVLAPQPAHAALAVFDGTAVGKAIEQLNTMREQIKNQVDQLMELRKQFDVLTETKEMIDDFTRAVGKIATINVPIPDLDAISNQAKNDIGCLIPKGTSWGVNTTDWNYESICSLSGNYRSSLFVSWGDATDYQDQRRRVVEARKRRAALLEDTVSRALAQADKEVSQTERSIGAADALQQRLNAAETLQDRLHVNGQIAIAQLRETQRTNQLLATMLKLQATSAAQTGLGAFESEGGAP